MANAILDATRDALTAACGLDARFPICAPSLYRLHALAESLLGVAFISIGLALLIVVMRRRDMVLRRMRALFGLLACASGAAILLGVAGALSASPSLYLADAALKLTVGGFAAATSAVLWCILPRFLRLPSLNTMKEANQRLQAAQADTVQANRWLTLSEQIAHVGHWRLSRGAGGMLWSAEVYRIFGLSHAAGPLDARAIHRAWHPDDRAVVQRAALRALRAKSDFDAEARVIRPDGEVRHILIRGLYQPPAVGLDSSLFGICLDRTEQKRIEQDLDQARAAAEQAMQRLEEQALQDGLTGLANRRRFDDALDGEFRRTKRLGLPLSLIMLDVDNFKQYNDLYGHPAGDECLRAIAVEVSRPLRRPGDLAARYGGEELVILMPGIPLAAAALIAARIVRGVRDLAIEHHGSRFGYVTISAGVAALVPTLGDRDPLPLLQQADKALYDAKRGGRNQVCVFWPTGAEPAPALSYRG